MAFCLAALSSLTMAGGSDGGGGSAGQRLSLFLAKPSLFGKATARPSTVNVAKAVTSRENREARHQLVRKKEVAKKVGETIAKSCLEKGIEKVAFDRGGYPYHWGIKALAEAARDHGLQF